MAIMRPKFFLDRYTTLRIPDPRTGVAIGVAMTSYGSGWDDDAKMRKENPEAKPAGNRGPLGPICQAECNQGFGVALRYGYDPKKHKALPASFHFTEAPLVDYFRAEQFYKMSYVRAFLGKGSPDEIVDTLRLALAVGRIGVDKDMGGRKPPKPTLQEYVKQYITLDCNGLTGNYYGIHPSTSIQTYAAPAKRRMSAQEVKMGDCIVTVTRAGGYQHVALVDEFTCPPTTDKTPTCGIKICEWGQSGGEDKHYTGNVARMVKIERGPNAKYGIGFRSGTNFRYIFAPPQDPEPRGWGLGGDLSK